MKQIHQSDRPLFSKGPERRFVITVTIATLIYILLHITLGLTSYNTGVSLLDTHSPMEIALYLAHWLFFFSLAAIPLIKQEIPHRIRLISVLLMYIALSLSRVWILDFSPLVSDARLNYQFMLDASNTRPSEFMEFYNSSTKPPFISLNDPEIKRQVNALGLEGWTESNWNTVEGNIRCGLTPPFFFILAFVFKLLFGWIVFWPLLFTLTFGILTLLLVYHLIAKHFGATSAYVVILTFALLNILQAGSTSFLNDVPALFLFFASLFLLDMGRNKARKLLFFIGGAIAALACLTRLSFVPQVSILMLLLLLHCENRLTTAFLFVSGFSMVLLLFVLLGFNPVALMFTARLIRDNYVSLKGMTASHSLSIDASYLVKLLVSLGFGWLVLALRSCFITSLRIGRIPFWAYPSGYIFVLAAILSALFTGMAPQLDRNFYASYILVFGTALASGNGVFSKRIAAVCVSSAAVISLVQILV